MSAEAGVRLRQAVLVARDLAPVSERLRGELGLGDASADSLLRALAGQVELSLASGLIARE